MSVRLIVAILLVAVVAVQSQIPIPSRYDGYAQGSSASPILFEMVGDLLCSDCLTTWPNIKSGLDYFFRAFVYVCATSVEMSLSLFPCHENIFI
jgi:hypothetical protein